MIYHVLNIRELDLMLLLELSNDGCLVVETTDNIYNKFNIKDIK